MLNPDSILLFCRVGCSSWDCQKVVMTNAPTSATSPVSDKLPPRNESNG
jgi:hypothetical protein